MKRLLLVALLLAGCGDGQEARPALHDGTRGAIADVRGAVDELHRLGAKQIAVVGAWYVDGVLTDFLTRVTE